MPGQTHHIDVGGVRRTVLVQPPAEAPTAIVVSMLGRTSTPAQQAILSRMASMADLGAVVAYPQGSVPARAGWEWDLDTDVAFLDTAAPGTGSTPSAGHHTPLARERPRRRRGLGPGQRPHR